MGQWSTDGVAHLYTLRPSVYATLNQISLSKRTQCR